jgi:cardiolipin synthase
MNLPNLLTISRFFLIPVYIYIFLQGALGWAFAVVVLAGLTDILDGYLARSRGQITQLGVMLDPLADKSMMIVVILSLLYANLIPWYAAAVIFLRDLGMIMGSAFFHFRGKQTVPANMFGKVNTILYYSAVLFIILDLKFAMTYLWFVILFSVVTTLIYIYKFKALNQIESTVH